jgi:hypothetical protein
LLRQGGRLIVVVGLGALARVKLYQKSDSDRLGKAGFRCCGACLKSFVAFQPSFSEALVSHFCGSAAETDAAARVGVGVKPGEVCRIDDLCRGWGDAWA